AAQIEEAVADFGVDTPRARGIAARRTRDVKRHTPVGELLPVWRRELADVGWPVERLDQAIAQAGMSYEPPGPLTDNGLQRLVADALAADGVLSRRKV